MARIRVLKVKGKVKVNKPKVMNFHSENFDRYTSQKRGKYNLVVINNTQKDKFLNNQLRAYSAKIRFHT
jgi:hypothetical protein